MIQNMDATRFGACFIVLICMLFYVQLLEKMISKYISQSLGILLQKMNHIFI
jgi:hypothetical protein